MEFRVFVARKQQLKWSELVCCIGTGHLQINIYIITFNLCQLLNRQVGF